MEMVWDWRSIGSLLASAMLLRTAIRDFLPPELLRFLTTLLSRILTSLRPTDTIIIEELDSSSGNTNELFDSAQLYLSSRCLSSAPSIRLSKPQNSPSLTSSLPSSHTTEDSFQNVPLRWTFNSVERQSSDPFSRRSDHRYFELSFHRQHRAIIHSLYIPQVLEVAEEIRFKSRERRLYSNRSISPFDDDRRLWSSTPFNHPSTFDSLAIDPTLRDDIRSDLLRFCSRRDYYTRAGRAWKRGYLLHGPPGTGKTSLIAAMANFLDFDVYDLELTAVTSNNTLRKLLVSTTSKSIIVVEDVDCSLDLTDRQKKKKEHDGNENDGSEAADPTKQRFSTVTLSGVLNFVDGLWSSCVGERLMVFTTNHPERLDPAMLRPGRMDRRISLSYCEAPAFRILARNYLDVEEGHEMMAEAEELLGQVRMTPAEVAEILMGCDDVGDGPDVGMRKVVEEMKRRKAVESLSTPLPVAAA